MEVEAEASRPARPHPQLTQLDEIGILLIFRLSPRAAYPYVFMYDGWHSLSSAFGRVPNIWAWACGRSEASVRKRGAGRTTLPSHSCACVGSIDANSAATTNANWRILSSLRDTPDTFTYARWRDEGVGTSPPVSPSTVDSLPLKATVAATPQQAHCKLAMGRSPSNSCLGTARLLTPSAPTMRHTAVRAS